MMKLFETNEFVSEFRYSIVTEVGIKHADKLVELAWYLRQSDKTQALALCDEAGATAGISAIAQARIGLIRAETQLQSGKPGEAVDAARLAFHEFLKLVDYTGCADASMFLSKAVVLAGQGAEQTGHITTAIGYAELAQDDDRILICRVRSALGAAYHEPKICQTQWEQEFLHQLEAAHPATAAMMCNLASTIAYGLGDLISAARWSIRSLEGLERTGQTSSYLGVLGNISEFFNALNERDASLDWAHRALDAARKFGWPMSVGVALARVAENLRKLGRAAAATPLLEEALQLLRPFYGSNNYGIMLAEMGQNALANNRNDAALEHFEELLGLSLDTQGRGIPVFQSTARIGKAKALIALNRLDDAWMQAWLGLQLEREIGHDFKQIEVMQIMAQICVAKKRFAEAREILIQALDLGDSIEGHTASPSIYLTLGEVHAALTQFEPAYHDVVRANVLRDQLHLREAESRAAAMEVRLSIQKSIADAERERQRAEMLHKGLLTLQSLGEVGQEITATLDIDKVLDSLRRHVNRLMPAECFAIYLLQADAGVLVSALNVELDKPLAVHTIQMSSATSYCAKCALERQIIAVDLVGGANDPSYIPGTLPTKSALFSPLVMGEQLLGVMSIQACAQNAYGDTERMIFRSLSAYAAIGIANAITYTRLLETQNQLIAQEKMAALGSLVAGVSHELNTPIGNSLLTNSSLQEQHLKISEKMAGQTLTRSDLKAFVDNVGEATALVDRGLSTAARLVQSFKQVAVDRTTEQRRTFDLSAACADVAVLHKRSIEKAGHTLAIEVQAGIQLDSYPGAIEQILTHLFNNALVHGFSGQPGGFIRISAGKLPNEVIELIFSDNGQGIAPAHLGRVFDPFFTTRMGQGGGGLGLSISHILATAILGGELSVLSEPGAGSSFILRIPAKAPQS